MIELLRSKNKLNLTLGKNTKMNFKLDKCTFFTVILTYWSNIVQEII